MINNNVKYVDISSIIQVIGCIYQNPDLLDNEKYSFNEDDFTEEFHKILFGSIYNLHLLGAKGINVNTIEDYLKDRPTSLAIYKGQKGAEYLEKISKTVQLSTFDYYYQRMKKMTLLRMYQKIGMDLSWLYDINNILDIKKKQAQEDWLDNNSLEDIAEIIDNKITEIKMKYIDNADDDMVQAGDHIVELIDNLQKRPELGYPMYGPFINTITRGARLKKFYLWSAATGVGKALPNSTTIPTPEGYTTVGQVKVGDYLFDAFGKPTKVLAVYPQGEKEVWEVTFKDGRKARCCEDHLWSYCTEGQRREAKEGRKFYTDTLKDLSKKELYQKGYGYKILVPMQKAVEYKEKEYYIKPYSFGLLLGDGNFRYSKEQKSLSYSSENEILPSKIAEEMDWNYKKSSEFNYSWTFEWKGDSIHKNVWVEETLKDFPDLWNVKSEDKYIPEEYLRGSISQRFDLLNGLLDSDGSVDKEKGRISYHTISPNLRDGVIELARSLGFKTSMIEDTHKDANICYRIEISGQPEDKIKLFKLNRKKELILQWYNNGKRKENNLFNPIVEIKKLNYSEEMTCFYVDNEEHLFLMNDYIVTHNTRFLVSQFASISCDEIYDISLGRWIENGTKEPAMFVTTEQEIDEIQTLILAFLSGVDESHIIYNSYEDGELERVLYAAKVIQKSPMYIKKLPDFSLKDIENTIKYGIKEWGARYIFFDYLHTSMKILSEVTSKTGIKGLREDNVLFMISIRLKDLCNEYGVFIMSATQLNADYVTAQQYDQNLLRGAKSIADKIDLGAIMLQTSQEDQAALKDIILKGGFSEPNIKISIYKNRRGQYKDILLWCYADRAICRFIPLFATDYQYKLIELTDLKIKINPKIEASAF
jgi:replicative DNA helicase